MSKQSFTTASLIKQSIKPQAPLFKTTQHIEDPYEQVEEDEDYFE